MIFVSRNQQDDAGATIQPPRSWLDDAAQRTATFTPTSHVINGAFYKRQGVKDALGELFSAKCAYCEVQVVGAGDWDVEHFRPKGKVAERLNHPGYYWLAYEWTNLYLACQHCNQIRIDHGIWGDPQSGQPGRGKMAQFPLRNEQTRAMTPGERIEDEERLLLDPCLDADVEDLLGFELGGDPVAIGDDDQAVKTIEVMHLAKSDKSGLRRRRIKEITDAVDRMDSQPMFAQFSRREIFSTLIEHYISDRLPHAGLARAMKRRPAAFGF